MATLTNPSRRFKVETAVVGLTKVQLALWELGLPVLDADTHPDVLRPFKLCIEVFHALGTLSEHLKPVPVCLAHRRENFLYKAERNFPVKEIAH